MGCGRIMLHNGKSSQIYLKFKSICPAIVERNNVKQGKPFGHSLALSDLNAKLRPMKVVMQ